MHSIESEQAVLGAILKDPTLIKECNLTPSHFMQGKHYNIFWTMKHLDNAGIIIDVISISEKVGSAKLEKIGGLEYLISLVDAVPTTSNFKYYVSVVAEYYQKRQAFEVAEKLKNEELTVKDAISELMNIEQSSHDDDTGDIGDVIISAYNSLENATDEVTGVKTHYTELDNITGGLQMQDLIILGARPSMGKTAFALNIALNTSTKSENDISVIFSLEMGKEQLMKRLMSITSRINGHKMKSAMKHFSDEEWKKMTMTMGILSTAREQLKIFDKAGIDINYIWSKVRKIKRNNEDKRIVVYIDYLQLIRGTKKLNRYEEISEISRSLKEMARELNVCVIALSQLSRGVEQRQDKRPMLSDLRESGQIEQDADIIMFLYRDDYYNAESEQKNITELIIGKHRNGSIGTVNLAFLKEYGQFLNLSVRN